MQEDLTFLGQMAGVTFGEIAANPSGGGGSDRAMEYFGQLSREVVGQLYELYWVDFEMFGYQVEEYLGTYRNWRWVNMILCFVIQDDYLS